MDHKPDLNVSISESRAVYQGERMKKKESALSFFLSFHPSLRVVGVVSVFADVAALLQAACLCSCLCIIHECTLLGSRNRIFSCALARKCKLVCFLFVFVQQKLWFNVILMRK